jgi:hypothetical protein
MQAMIDDGCDVMKSHDRLRPRTGLVCWVESRLILGWKQATDGLTQLTPVALLG